MAFWTAAVGLTLFFLGMWMMTGAFHLDQTRLHWTHNWWRGALIGTVLTAVSQSSSAVTVLLVAAVCSGQISLFSAFGVLLGANIGTTATAWLVQLGQLPGVVGWLLPALLCLLLAWQSQNMRIACGLAVLLFGMHTMTTAAQSLGQGETALYQALQSPWKGGLWGAGVTAVLQSSSVTVGMLQALAGSGGITMAQGRAGGRGEQSGHLCHSASGSGCRDKERPAAGGAAPAVQSLGGWIAGSILAAWIGKVACRASGHQYPNRPVPHPVQFASGAAFAGGTINRCVFPCGAV